MAKSISIAILCFLMMTLQNCSTNKVALENISRQWMLIQFQDFPREMLVKNRANIDFSKKADNNQYHANMGCNQMFFTAKFQPDGKVKFSEMGSTLMYCQDKMNLEMAFGKTLPTITKYQIKGHELLLSNEKGETMKFVAADWD